MQEEPNEKRRIELSELSELYRIQIGSNLYNTRKANIRTKSSPERTLGIQPGTQQGSDAFIDPLAINIRRSTLRWQLRRPFQGRRGRYRDRHGTQYKPSSTFQQWLRRSNSNLAKRHISYCWFLVLVSVWKECYRIAMLGNDHSVGLDTLRFLRSCVGLDLQQDLFDTKI